jgi:hypothetical protein
MSSSVDFNGEEAYRDLYACVRHYRLNMESNMLGQTSSNVRPKVGSSDATFELHYSISDLARQWRLGRETVRVLVKDEPGGAIQIHSRQG